MKPDEHSGPEDILTGRDPTRVQSIKQRRAEQLARRVQRASADPRRGDARRHLVVRLGSERYGIPVAAIDRIHFPCPVTPLPGVPPFIAGVICLVGEALTLVDLAVLLHAVPGDASSARILVVRVAAERMALRVDGIEGIREFTEINEFAKSSVVESWLIPEQVEGIAEGAVVLLDLQRVLRDPRIRVGREESLQ